MDVLKFEAVYKDYLWGGTRLKDYGKVDPEGRCVAESWELAHHPNGESIVREGALKGKSLGEVLHTYGRDLVGSLARKQDLKKFPLLIKLIDADQNLSVQVHPNDAEAARLRPGEYGKNEMWYVVNPPTEGALIAGVRPEITREDFAAAIDEGRCEECLSYAPVEAGEAVNIPAGLVHAITSGAIIYEVQQNSDTTFRVYDYNRRGQDGKLRELHVAEALEVSRFGEDIQAVYEGLDLSPEERLLVANRYFQVSRLQLDPGKTLELTPCGKTFHVLTVLQGAAELHYVDTQVLDAEVERCVSLTKGETGLVPASIGRYELRSTGEEPCLAILSQLPDPERLSRAADLAQKKGSELERQVGLEPKP